MMEQKIKPFKDDLGRETAVVMAVQNIGVAPIKEIIEKIESYGAKITQKQVEKACENLQKRQIFSVDLKVTGVKRYLMRRIGVSVPEIGQIRAIVDAKGEDSEEIRALINELEASKKNAKIANNDYYNVDVTFRTKGKVYGFVPDGNGINNAHYRDVNGNVIFYRKHFRGWLRNGMPLMNKYVNEINKIFFFNSTTDYNKECPKENTFITNVMNTHKGAGRGDRVLEYLPENTKIKTKFRVPAISFTPDDFEKLLVLTGESHSFGGCSKISNSELLVENFELGEKIMINN